MNITAEFQKHFRPRLKTAHKGDFGRIFILAGSEGLSGACFLASMAALRSGAGLVTVGVPKCLVSPLARRLTEAMMLALPETKEGTLSKSAYPKIQRYLKGQDILAVGPGLSMNPETQTLIRKAVLNSTKPSLIDADGLNAFTKRARLLGKAKSSLILTPHVGEFVRIFGGAKPKTDPERRHRALQAAKQSKAIVVLKGYRTVVVSPDGEVYVNKTGNPGMATGGSGDVLTGVIAAMLGQRVPPFLAACFGVFIHGLAGDLAKKKSGEISLVAGDILNALPLAFKNTLKHRKAPREAFGSNAD